MHKGKIFCIGFNRCGTNSIKTFLKKLGYRATHDPHWWYWKINKIDKFNRFDAFTDGFEGYKKKSVFPNLNFLDAQFPNSKFIVNTRSLRRWLVSRYRHGSPTYLKSHNTNQIDSSVFSAWTKDRNNWYTEIENYFKEKNNLLIANIEDSKCANIIANFLGSSETFERLPHENNTADPEYHKKGEGFDWIGYPHLNGRESLTGEKIKSEINNFLEDNVKRSDWDSTWTCELLNDKS